MKEKLINKNRNIGYNKKYNICNKKYTYDKKRHIIFAMTIKEIFS